MYGTNFPAVVVELVYPDVDAAMAWIERVLGFHPILTYPATGPLEHVDLDVCGGVVMLKRASDTRPTVCLAGQACTKLIIRVNGVDSHHARALGQGATIIQPPCDKPWGLRQYVLEDLAGHVWEFSEHVRDLSPESWGATPH